MATETGNTPRLEIAHVLFTDIVGYSRLPMDRQTRVLQELYDIVRATEEYRRAVQGQIISLPTGDGMALVFFGDPETALRCAVEIGRALRRTPSLQLRMGVHSGPVYRVDDINTNMNVAGGGINMAQRVMDCGDAGHILVSRRVADDLLQLSTWEGLIHDLGEAEVKHGVRVQIFNVYGEGYGNPEPPKKFCAPPPHGKESTTEDAEGHGGRPEDGRGNGRSDISNPKSQIDDPDSAIRNPQSAIRNSSASPVVNSSAGSAGPSGTKQLRVALLYKRGARPDEHVLRFLETELTRAGHSVFIDRHLTIGVEWAKEIERQVRSADAVVPLLSAASAQSEMVAYEVQIAHEAAQQSEGRPRVLPVRVGFEGPLPEPLASILAPIQYFLWRDESDDQLMLSQLLGTLVAPAAEEIDPKELKQPGGAVALDSKLYVVRPTDEEFLQAIRRRDSIVLVKGARQMGKTSLLARGMALARKEGSEVVMTDFQKLNASHLESVESFFLALAEMLYDQLDLDTDPEEAWNPKRGASINFERYVRREVLKKVEKPLVWAMDEVDRLLTVSFGSEVFGLFRSWHNERQLDPTSPWERLTLAIVYATEPHLFISDQNQSPFNVGTKLELRDFTAEQVADMNQRIGSPLATRDEIGRFQQMLGGHPYLVHRGLYEMKLRGLPFPEFAAAAARDEGPYGDHLRRILVLLARDNELTEEVRRILRGQPCESMDNFYRLRSAGLVAGDSSREAILRCSLYGDYLGRHLL
ncbi:MAG TPA: AAA-like domain-containing protein [Pyrinomonadaceae bacterium]|nr:AAA-like domain-containing protein [Pyrinomonadaceae bacterium]